MGSSKDRTRSLPRFVWKMSRVVPRLLYRLGLGRLIGRTVLLLTTKGRKTGLPRQVPLQYEEIDGRIYLGVARGQRADWFRNLQVNPEVTVQLGGRCFHGRAEGITDPVAIADFLEARLRRHPRMVGLIARLAGLPKNPTRTQLEAYAANRAVAIITPDLDQVDS